MDLDTDFDFRRELQELEEILREFNNNSWTTSVPLTSEEERPEADAA